MRHRSVPKMCSECTLYMAVKKSVRYVSRAHLTHLWTGGDIMDVLSLSGILYLILMKAQQERAFLCLLLQLRRRRTAQQRIIIRAVKRLKYLIMINRINVIVNSN